MSLYIACGPVSVSASLSVPVCVCAPPGYAYQPKQRRSRDSSESLGPKKSCEQPIASENISECLASMTSGWLEIVVQTCPNSTCSFKITSVQSLIKNIMFPTDGIDRSLVNHPG